MKMLPGISPAPSAPLVPQPSVLDRKELRRLHRLEPIEGLRAYLALWVVISHVLFFSAPNFYLSYQDSALAPLGALLESGPFAVQVFMMVSGFVIFFLIDRQRESYGQFILRRFFRLYPLYVILLFLAMLSAPWHHGAFLASQAYMEKGSIDYYNSLYNSTWDHWGWNLGWHLTMLHGIVPNAWLGGKTAYGFIISAWSISVEWQFYLAAPLIYKGVSGSPGWRMCTLAAVVIVYLIGRHGDYFSAFLPPFLPYFCVGICSYPIYKVLHSTTRDVFFPMTFSFALFLFIVAGRPFSLVPYLLWLPFLGLLCEHRESYSYRWLVGFFTNRVVQYLGAISYGIYLCHELVLVGGQTILLDFLPGLSRSAYCLWLLVLTVAGTIAVASLLHYLVEVPGIEWGRKLARRFRSAPSDAI